MNKNKLLKILISNLSNAVLHKILEKSVKEKELANKYFKEVNNSFELAKNYREKINPKNEHLKESKEVEQKIIQKVKLEINKRITKGYKGLNTNNVEKEVKLFPEKLKI